MKRKPDMSLYINEISPLHLKPSAHGPSQKYEAILTSLTNIPTKLTIKPLKGVIHKSYFNPRT